MAGRPPKESIDYAGWAADIFDNEPKIDKLMDAQGCVGFTIYFFLCQKAYGSNGYFYPWCFDDSATTARKIGGGASARSVEETVKLCFRVGLLNEELYDRWRILTSRGIQKNYMKVALTRTNKSVISEYWLLSDEESEGLIKVALKQGENRISPPHNSIMPQYNPHFSGSTVEDTIVENTTVEDTNSPASPQGGKEEPPPQSNKSEAVPYTKIMEMYNRICTSLPKIKIIDGARKKAVSARFKTYGNVNVFQTLFEKTEASSFLKGANDRNWRADFDWIIKPTNMAKVLEGKYDNDRWVTPPGKGPQQSGGNPFLEIAREKGYIQNE